MGGLNSLKRFFEKNARVSVALIALSALAAWLGLEYWRSQDSLWAVASGVVFFAAAVCLASLIYYAKEEFFSKKALAPGLACLALLILLVVLENSTLKIGFFDLALGVVVTVAAPLSTKKEEIAALEKKRGSSSFF